MSNAAESRHGPTPPGPARDPQVLIALLLLYATQGLPFGIAAEYLPVVMRGAGYSQTVIAAAGWLQLPWQLKVLWAHVADRKSRVSHARLLFVIQCLMAILLIGYGFRSFPQSPKFWFALTAALAFVAASQDVFVDALAVRSLSHQSRGLGNSIQVGGYRAGMLVGGALLLLLSDQLGLPLSMTLLAGFVLAAAGGAFLLRGQNAEAEATAEAVTKADPPPVTPLAVLKHALQKRTWVVLALATTYKLGIHIAAPLIKPMTVDAGWSKTQIGLAVVTYGTAAGFVGAFAGGLLHRQLRERTALAIAMLVQMLACVPLAAASALHVPRMLTTVAIATEHFASGVGTTVLFAALMTATRKSMAGAHYTLLTSANALAIGAGGMLGGALADTLGRTAAFMIGAGIAVVPLGFLGAWPEAAVESAQESNRT
jgi:MFS transporter, PAT family, beta-lactamase induction signal transducer AmpG